MRTQERHATGFRGVCVWLYNAACVSIYVDSVF